MRRNVTCDNGCTFHRRMQKIERNLRRESNLLRKVYRLENQEIARGRPQARKKEHSTERLDDNCSMLGDTPSVVRIRQQPKNSLLLLVKKTGDSSYSCSLCAEKGNFYSYNAKIHPRPFPFADISCLGESCIP